MKQTLTTLFFIFAFQGVHFAQTVPVTFHADANNTQYQTVQMWHNIYEDFTDEDHDRIFELSLDLEPGIFNYYLLRDNAWGWDPHNPLPGGGNGGMMTVSDPMISYLLPKDNDMMRENRIQANFAYSPGNPPIENTIQVSINESSVDNAAQYFDASKRELIIPDPANLVKGSNTISVSYTTNQGAITRSSTFAYQAIKLMTDTMVYRMNHILSWGRVFSLPYPASVFLSCNDEVYEAQVNAEGYFGADIDIADGDNVVRVAYDQAGLSNPVDQETIVAEIRHIWWVELEGSVSGNTATINAVAHDVDENDLTLDWHQSADSPAAISISGNTKTLSFDLPGQEGEYKIELVATATSGEVYTARKMLTTKGNTHFIDVNERAPWMETMVLYEVEGDFFDWGDFRFDKMKEIFQHMKDLGVNAFRFTPFVQGGFISWDHFDISPHYGSIDDLRAMTDMAHQYGLKVFFDVPLSHTASFHTFILSNFLLKEQAEPYYDFSLWQGDPGESDIVYSPDNGRQCVYTNLENPYTQEYFTRLMEYWVEVGGADGFRIDCGQESFLRSPDYIKQLHKRLRNIKPDLFILEEGDNRDHPAVNYYDFGDAAYDWKLNTQWGGGMIGLPGMFQGSYTTDQLHELLTTGTPDSGLVMRYANTGYFDYLRNIYGEEQERSAVALVTTTYGLPNIRAGEEVGLARANGMYDLSDPDGVMPYYTRLIKARKSLLGNYPVIERYTENVPTQVYAYASKAHGNIVLTVINFSAGQTNLTVNLQNSIFESTGQSNWYNVADDLNLDHTALTEVSLTLDGWEAKVYAVDLSRADIYPAASSITLESVSGEYEIDTDKGSLNFMTSMFPESSMDDIEWDLEGDTDLATMIEGTLIACGCGKGEVTVIARSAQNPEAEDRKTVTISEQLSGQVGNSSFDSDVQNWFLWTPDCTSYLEWSAGEAHLVYQNAASCYSQLMNQDNMHLESGKSYKVSFDARANVSSTIGCTVKKNGEDYQYLCTEEAFSISQNSQSYSFEFTATQNSEIAQIQFNVEAANAEFWFDNVSFCEVSASSVGMKSMDAPRSAIRIYPNPVKDNLTIETSDPGNKASFCIYSMSGRLVKTVQIRNQNHVAVDVHDFESGVYFIEISNNESKEWFKFMKL